uniref:TNF receptor superfamily member 9 n=1 Tax=Molossus molossus TaxID=27622 RepID=A0A7J8FCH3_MOLMO|nr:TNF receptor superfamily member 9 [Molossus molossus]
MGNGYYSLMATVLLVTSFERTLMQDPCRSCPAGTFCGQTKNPSCIPCPSDSFSSAGGQKACDICRRCEGVFRTRRVCTPTSNAECECIPGFHCRGAGCSMCEPDCRRGQELTLHGCEDCSAGTFNDQKHGPVPGVLAHGPLLRVRAGQEETAVHVQTTVPEDSAHRPGGRQLQLRLPGGGGGRGAEAVTERAGRF